MIVHVDHANSIRYFTNRNAGSCALNCAILFGLILSKILFAIVGLNGRRQDGRREVSHRYLRAAHRDLPLQLVGQQKGCFRQERHVD